MIDRYYKFNFVFINYEDEVAVLFNTHTSKEVEFEIPEVTALLGDDATGI